MGEEEERERGRKRVMTWEKERNIHRINER